MLHITIHDHIDTGAPVQEPRVKTTVYRFELDGFTGPNRDAARFVDVLSSHAVSLGRKIIRAIESERWTRDTFDVSRGPFCVQCNAWRVSTTNTLCAECIAEIRDERLAS